MNAITSSKFASASAKGNDWRDTSKSVLKQLQSIIKTSDKYTLGFLYVTDTLADDMESILNLFRSVLEIENWVGTVGIGVFSSSNQLMDDAAISAMICQFDSSEFCIFKTEGHDIRAAEKSISNFMKNKSPMLVFVHGDPMAEEDPALTLPKIEDISGGFVTGGLSSSRKIHVQIANTLHENGISGVIFADSVPVATTLSQGCNIIGPQHIITRADGHVIDMIDDKKAADVFEEDLREMAMKKIGQDPDDISVEQDPITGETNLPPEYKTVFKGEIMIGFPVSESDQRDYLVRNIVNIQEDGSMMISDNVSVKESMLFVHRDDDTVREDLCKSLLELRDRITKDHGEFNPKGAIYVSCLGRAFSREELPENHEISLIRDIIGDIPLTGFYAGGEISSARLYGYTGILTLFL